MPNSKIPGYLLHKPTGQARVRIRGKDHWLGKHGSPESYERYSAVILDWQQAAKQAPSGVTFGQLFQMFRKHSERHYRKNSQETSEVGLIRYALNRMNRVARNLLLAEISPRHLKQARELMIKEVLPRDTINRFIQRIRRCVKWAVGEELCPASVLVGLFHKPTLLAVLNYCVIVAWIVRCSLL